MNNDLEQFSEERLEEIIECSELNDNSEIAALARIALSTKQANPVCYADQSDIDRIKSGSTTRIGSYQTNVMSIALYTTPQPAHTEQAIPDGWKLVPIQPTEEMINAWDEDMGQSYARVHAEQIGEDEVVFAYQAMLAAAPKPESE